MCGSRKIDSRLSAPTAFMPTRALCATLFFGALLDLASMAQAQVVEFQTSLGGFQVELFSEDAPLTVANFLSYVDSGAYSDSIVHRAIQDFVIQGGGFEFNETGGLTEVAQQDPVNWEDTGRLNVRGTLAMARFDHDINSGTSQWYINHADNAYLDTQGGGYVVFGVVLGHGMEVVDAIANLPTIRLSGPLIPFQAQRQLPYRGHVPPPLTHDNLVFSRIVRIPEPRTLLLAGLGITTLWHRRR